MKSTHLGEGLFVGSGSGFGVCCLGLRSSKCGLVSSSFGPQLIQLPHEVRRLGGFFISFAPGFCCLRFSLLAQLQLLCGFLACF